MDNIPFLEFNILDIKEDSVNELKRFLKDVFDMKGILDSASELKYLSMVKKTISEQFHDPSDQLIRSLITKTIYNGTKTQAVLDNFREVIRKSFNEYVNDLMSERLKNAISQDAPAAPKSANVEKESNDFTDEELKVLNFVRKLINTDQELTYKKPPGMSICKLEILLVNGSAAFISGNLIIYLHCTNLRILTMNVNIISSLLIYWN